MSRIGKQPIKIPEKVKVDLTAAEVKVKGPLGELTLPIDPYMELVINQGIITVKMRDQSDEALIRHGLFRTLVANMVHGVSEGFKKELEINGVGYRAEVKGQILVLALGHSHPIEFHLPQGVKAHVEKQTRITLSGASKEVVGEAAAIIRKKYRPVEPYKGKGVRYVGEIVRKKVGKAAVGSGGGK
ncbi:MAG: 50S ribosomal protein L6 [Deltaproteobacteria bacterium]|nr:50S ribosomal protein L6 [Deltaproteobacteria bacterium]